MNKISGVITALATPFNKGEIDKRSFAALLKHQLDHGVQGFVINGTTGESPTLDMQEVESLVAIAKTEVAGQVPVIIGTGSNSTEKACEQTKLANSWKPDAILVVVPYYNRPPQRGLVKHFTTIADQSKAPVILYNVPSRSAAGLEAETIGELAGHPNIAGIKEATGNMEFLTQIQKVVPREFILLSGDDPSCVDFCARGGHGVISVSSHIIGEEMRHYIKTADHSGYLQKFTNLMKHLYVEANPIPVKAALHWMKLFTTMEMRLPLMELDQKYHKDFKECLAALGKI